MTEYKKTKEIVDKFSDSSEIKVYLDRNKDIVQLHDELIIPNKHYVESTIETWLTTYEGLVDQLSMKVIATFDSASSINL